MEYPRSYTVWDLETTGLDPTRDRIVEVAFMKVHEGVIVQEFSAIVDHGIEIPEAASNIHGITTEKAKAEGWAPEKAIRILYYEILAAPATVTHNGTRFDHFFMEAELARLDSLPHPMDLFGNVTRDKSIDTTALFKARKLGLEPQEGETHYAFPSACSTSKHTA